MRKTAISGNFRSAEYLEGLFRLTESLVLDQHDREALAARYRQALEWCGLDQREFGDLLGYSDRHVRSYLEGKVENLAARSMRSSTPANDHATMGSRLASAQPPAVA